MITYLIIVGKTSLALMLFYLFYRIVLAKDKLFKRNRFFLAGVVLASFVLPWVTIPLIHATPNNVLTVVYVTGANSISPQLNNPEPWFSWIQIVVSIYLIGIAFFFLKTLIAYFQVFKIIRNAFHVPLGKQRLVTTHRNLSPFSFLHWIVIPNNILQHPSFDKMVQHELVHCRQYHSVDLFIAEMLVFLQWFNPFAWLLRKAISENLEYLVDEEMLKRGTNAKDYQYSLLSFSMVGLKPAVANYFNTNLLKKRIVMMNTNIYSRNYRLRNMLIPVSLIFVMFFTVSFQKQAKAANSGSFERIKPSGKTEAFTNVIESKTSEVNPSQTVVASESHSEEIILGYLMKQIVYPKEAISRNQEGVVEIPVKFSSNGAEISNLPVNSGERLKQVVVVGYGSGENKKSSTDNSNSESLKLLQEEVLRVVKTFSDVPKDIVGKTYIVSVKFILDEVRVTGYSDSQNKNLDENVKVQVRNVENTNSGEPTFILNDDKIITKEEMQKIDPNTVQTVQVIKGEQYTHKKLGEIKGSVVIITLKK